ncbi:MAG: 3-deoxy-D-manno-octulosonic acid transferase [Pyrinomonadaceae bacterium]
MYFLYSILLGIGVAALLPRFILDALRHGKYAAGFRERTGTLPSFERRGRPVVWLHCVSVGETQAARPLARAVLEAYPSHALVVSTTTMTGQRIAREAFGSSAALVFYFPFDWAWSVRRALRTIQPSLALVMETELWPRFMRECRERGVPIALVNGRISEKSFRRYSRIKFFMKRVVGDLALALMQTDADAARLLALGLAPERVKVSGNVKFDYEERAGQQALTNDLRSRFHFASKRPLIIAASTHAPEERVVLEAYKLVTPSTTRPRLLIAPRHPERFAEVASLLASSGLTWTRRNDSPRVDDQTCDVILLDSIGELSGAYPLAEIVFVGGSIASIGGHNVLEPATAARCIVTGAHTSNFGEIVRTFLEQSALVQLPAVEADAAPEVLSRVLSDLLADDDTRRRMGLNARATLDQNRGATSRTVRMLSPLFQERHGSEDRMSLPDKVLTSDL